MDILHFAHPTQTPVSIQKFQFSIKNVQFYIRIFKVKWDLFEFLRPN